MIVFANEVLKFYDDSGALASRFITWRMKQSFLGKEDPDLTDKLLAERPGILNMVLDALDEVRIKGLRQHQSGEEMARSLETMTSDVRAFIEDCCECGPDKEYLLDSMFANWREWCEYQGIRYFWASPQFSEKLRAAVPTIRSGRPRGSGPGRPTMLYGIAAKGWKGK